MRYPIIILICSLSSTLFGQQTVIKRMEMHKKKIKKIIEVRYSIRHHIPDSVGINYAYKTFDESGNQIVTGSYINDSVHSPVYVRKYENGFPVERLWYCERTEENPIGKVCLRFMDYLFDEFGNVSREIGYNTSGDTAAITHFDRNKAGNPLRRRDRVFGDLASNIAYTYEYNNYGDVIKEVSIDTDRKDTSFVHKRYKYNRNYLISKVLVFDKDMRFTNSSTFVYNDRELLIEELKFDDSGNAYMKREFLYEFY